MALFISRRQRADEAAGRFFGNGNPGDLDAAFADLSPETTPIDYGLTASERRRRAVTAVGVGIAGFVVAGLISAGFMHYEGQSDSVESRMEGCVAEAVGHPVDLEVSLATGALQRPDSISAEVFDTCARQQQ